MKKTIINFPILTFLIITFALSSIFYFLIFNAVKPSNVVGIYVLGLMWCPGIAAFLTSLILGKKISGLGWRLGKTKYQLLSYLIPLLYSFIAYLIVWFFGWGIFYTKIFVSEIATTFGLSQLPSGLIFPLCIVLIATLGMLESGISALGEEIGWRGFLVPELAKKFNFTTTSLLSGFFWALWHFPILLCADFKTGTPMWFSLTCFTVLIIGMSFVFAWFRLKSNSLWTGVILHASHNLFIQSIFTPLTKDTGNTKYFIDEFGGVLPILCLFLAFYFWSKRSQLSNISSNVI